MDSEREQLARSLTKETRYITCETKDRMPTINSTWVPPPSKKRSFPDSGKPYCEQYAVRIIHLFKFNKDYALTHGLSINRPTDFAIGAVTVPKATIWISYWMRSWEHQSRKDGNGETGTRA